MNVGRHMFFKKGVVQIFSQFTGEHSCKSSARYSSANMLRTCSSTPFLVKTSGELLLYIAINSEIIDVEVLSKKIKKWNTF